ERRASERSPAEEFVPLSAEVAPQMTLFGPAPTVKASKATEPPPAESAPAAAFERRASLREERRRLVADLAKRAGSNHREINAWVNRTIGVQRVEAASIEQLERSVHALVRELTRHSRRAASG
ncbi:MAG: hypothetical protein ACRDJ3_11205, partial [Solirubrobacteraceae bacterium]